MSLRKLLNRNYFTVLTRNGEISEATHGAFEGDFVEHPDFTNIKGHIQEPKKNPFTKMFNAAEETHDKIIYHQNKALYNFFPETQTQNQTLLRVYTNINPLKPVVSLVESPNQVKVYEVMGHIQQVTGVRKFIYILKLKSYNHLEL